MNSIQEPGEARQDPRFWASRFGALTIKAIREGWTLDEVYHTAMLAASHAEDVLDCRPAFQIEVT